MIAGEQICIPDLCWTSIVQSGGKGGVKAGAGKGAAAPKVSEADRAVLQLKMQRDKMLQGRKKVQRHREFCQVCGPPGARSFSSCSLILHCSERESLLNS